MKRIKFCELRSLELSSVILYDAAASRYPMQNRGRAHHGLLYTHKGCEIYDFGGKRLYADENTVTYLPKGSVYNIYLDGEESSVTVFDFELPLEEEYLPFSTSFSENNKLLELFRDAERIWKKQSAGYYQECSAKLWSAFSLLAKKEESYLDSGVIKKIEPAVKILHEHYTEKNFRTEDLAAMVGMKSSYFRFVFSKKYGMSPKEYVLSLKMNRAKELLLGEKYTVSKISELLGFCDVYHFSKVFKMKTGISPTEYREIK